jgi:hypothetical protein
MIQPPSEFLESCVRKEARDRFKHDWAKRPERLDYRVCHDLELLFLPRFRGKSAIFGANEDVIVFFCGSARVMQYADAEALLDSGEGILLISMDGRRFLAQSEYVKGAGREQYGSS